MKRELEILRPLALGLLAGLTGWLVGAGAAQSAAAQAREIRLDQRIVATAVNSFPGVGGVLVSSDVITQHKGAPGAASGRGVVLFDNPGSASERCAGFAFELPAVGGSAIFTFADFSQLNTLVASGFLCTSGVGPATSETEFTVVGGSGRFEGASGTILVKFQTVDVGSEIAPELMSSGPGTATGTIVVGD